MVRALLIFTFLTGVAVFSQAPDAGAVTQNAITATSSASNYLVTVGQTFTLALNVDCTTTACVGYQYQVGYNAAVVSYGCPGAAASCPEVNASAGGFNLCANATVLPPPWSGVYGGCLRPDGAGQSPNALGTTLTFTCNAYGIVDITLIAYNSTSAPFGSRTVPPASPPAGDSIPTTLSATNVLCTNNDPTLDADGDGCKDTKEIASTGPLQGGQRDPTNPWDFFDVPTPPLLPGSTSGTRDKIVRLADVLAVLQYVGTSAANPNMANANGAKYGSDLNNNGVLDGVEYDRKASIYPAQPWRSGPPSGSVTLGDVLITFAQVGSNCS